VHQSHSCISLNRIGAYYYPETSAMSPRPKFDTIDACIAAVDPAVQPVLELIRRNAREALPAATECISYAMPALKLRKVFFFFAAFKQHIGIYPPLRPTGSALDRELAPFRGPKGNLQFPLSQPMPYDLITRVAIALAEQHGS
jgi:uncharacterized protein YdhG (YjbR/CyaY superfamily)